MRIVVIGGTGLIGSQVVQGLAEHGHDAVAAAPATGVNTLTGEGLADALTDAAAVVDVSNSPSFADDAAMEFFHTATTNLLAAEAAAAVGHHVALSVVGTDRLAAESGYFRAKLAQETLVRNGGLPYTIVRATQFFEFVRGIADAATDGDLVRLAPVGFQPIASADVAEAVSIAALGNPVNGITEIAGPQRYRLDELIRTALTARGDRRTVSPDPRSRYWGAHLQEDTLVPGPGATLFGTRFEEWLLASSAHPLK
ncbi:SDR family oxidoreductase [Mycolicibacterium diernhoferi]|uniref:NmrA family transcriptional regulator n=1 Tax=Mycolicibacterium diernhoferi TaxID=1801 RepID=A0A1Q4HI04_9MYCO|nr:SDR family oxidoreductase [Mycolicibacterium diernhoferi]OJZ67092.1 NmrA family transcriptional regulator [Mycolicibacterium diernhoferi]OPE56299.1 NmrA family transcriptional regulator [Mycolicibacterium diernhoferi]PEG53686.1 NmrA family transcriptional regulator [Mycolicibacterium diernhoferi]QYL23289.1 SDR family oxidoreductase [Mycolicibacterium diernhoferi]